jgi:alcohol dehydrogenase/L-iditol 2-dehydrogenase
LRVAKTVGASHTVLTEDLMQSVGQLGDGYGADVVIDAAGVSESLKAALDVVRPGGQVTKVGWGSGPLGFSMDPVVRKAVTLQGSYSHTWAVWERVLRMLDTGQLDPSPLLTKVSGLEDWKASFDGMHRGELVKAVLLP